MDRARAIATLGVKQRLYDGDAVEHVMLIAQARDLGFSVDAAIEAAAAFRARAVAISLAASLPDSVRAA